MISVCGLMGGVNLMWGEEFLGRSAECTDCKAPGLRVPTSAQI